MTNLLTALANIIENPIVDLVSHYKGSNRANSMGDALENYVKDAFCNTFFEKDDGKKDEIYNTYFSYLGNQNNPPDTIIKNGDAIEVKKIIGYSSSLALNSSYPKDKLHNGDTRIIKACKTCDGGNWSEKDIIYTIGVVPSKTNKLKIIWFVYGDCYAANEDIYKRVASKIIKGIKEIPDIELAKTNELAGIKKVDPLGITNLRVRGMWHIENPIKVFQNFVKFDDKNTLTVHAIILKEKYLSFPIKDIERLEKLQSNNFQISDIKIKSPNNPAELLEAKFINYAK